MPSVLIIAFCVIVCKGHPKGGDQGRRQGLAPLDPLEPPLKFLRRKDEEEGEEEEREREEEEISPPPQPFLYPPLGVIKV